MRSRQRAIFTFSTVFLLLLLWGLFLGCQSTPVVETDNTLEEVLTDITYGQPYSGKMEVAEYLHLYNELPPNFITKDEAQKLGWDSQEGNLWDVAKGMSIGGDRFGNREGLLPIAQGRQYYECDIHYMGGYREAERIVYSNDGLIFYTSDHYKTFEQLY